MSRWSIAIIEQDGNSEGTETFRDFSETCLDYLDKVFHHMTEIEQLRELDRLVSTSSARRIHGKTIYVTPEDNDCSEQAFAIDRNSKTVILI